MAHLGRAIERMINKIKKDEKSQAPKKALSASADLPAVYLKAFPLRSLDDVELFKSEIKSGNILIVRVSPLAKKSIEDVKRVVDDLCKFVNSIGGDIARLGEERVVITPSPIRIWREKTGASDTETTAA